MRAVGSMLPGATCSARRSSLSETQRLRAPVCSPPRLVSKSLTCPPSSHFFFQVICGATSVLVRQLRKTRKKKIFPPHSPLCGGDGCSQTETIIQSAKINILSDNHERVPGFRSSRRPVRLVAALVWAGRRLRPGPTCRETRLQRQLLCIRKMTLTRGLFSNRAEQLVHYGTFKGSPQTSSSPCVRVSAKKLPPRPDRHVWWGNPEMLEAPRRPGLV